VHSLFRVRFSNTVYENGSIRIALKIILFFYVVFACCREKVAKNDGKYFD